MSCMKERSTWLATSERSSVSVFIVTTRLLNQSFDLDKRTQLTYRDVRMPLERCTGTTEFKACAATAPLRTRLWHRATCPGISLVATDHGGQRASFMGLFSMTEAANLTHTASNLAPRALNALTPQGATAGTLNTPSSSMSTADSCICNNASLVHYLTPTCSPI
ncbi:hypothetical protein HBI56_032000 [Parastagonospora nodorum]|uniref:Uncharacterized protein n=1 Tax=Phaeosphaeria nodorum (strain SN15 / ATCC MYA-4574 / FGSC 10173) TaxID=321614 RepID=A0A7U2HXC8_PHANO|nr:hypothetical protein HBH56_019710 [Parastagonospora nodorum]QRC95370.1 hypothetical protein JI435_030630 [Parastagonospora nodorum SN15]KAH3937167.1 hypothetical protein HBH54_014790 [Parastagonospora nodorum]KAH3953434.1 hypothetical protein HBH53_026940 [Parastagonospora nodorum]KAH3962755.1 hypothetical protein HBH51_174860 [Parastagonospora nodorum]